MFPPKLHRWLFITLALCLLAGCAVLTVNVDVYKGPLANSEQAQSEQIISLVMGVKPLLVQLRDHLAVGPTIPLYKLGDDILSPFSSHSSSLQLRLADFRKTDWYNPGYIKAANLTGSGGPVYSNELTIRVNDILGLYEDRSPESEFISRARELASSYSENYSRLHPSDDTQGTALWNEISSKMTASKDLKNRLAPFFTQRSKLTYVEMPFFTNGLTNIPPNLTNTNMESEELSNERFAFLQTTSTIADQLFGGDAEETNTDKVRFKTYVSSVVGAYFNAREELDTFLRLSLRQIPVAHDPMALSAGPLKKALANCVAYVINLHLINELYISPPAANGDANAIEAIQNHFKDDKVYNEFVADIQKAIEAQNTGDSLQKARVALVGKLMHDDSHFVDELLEIDNFLSSPTSSLTRYSLARGPFKVDMKTTGGMAASPDDVAAGISSVASASNEVLNRGRPEFGLQKLVENYLNQQPDQRQFSTLSTNFAFQDFLSALLEFGQKVAIIGNSAVLLKENDRDIKSYVTILQTVGNSIIVYEDELKTWGLYNQDLMARSALVGDAIRDAIKITNSGFANWATNGLDAKQAAIQLTTVLRAEYIKALLDGGEPSTATNIVQTALTMPAGSLATDVITNVFPFANTNATSQHTLIINPPLFNDHIILTNVITLTGTGLLSIMITNFNPTNKLLTNKIMVASAFSGQITNLFAPSILTNLADTSYTNQFIVTNRMQITLTTNTVYLTNDGYATNVSFDVSNAIFISSSNPIPITITNTFFGYAASSNPVVITNVLVTSNLSLKFTVTYTNTGSVPTPFVVVSNSDGLTPILGVMVSNTTQGVANAPIGTNPPVVVPTPAVVMSSPGGLTTNLGMAISTNFLTLQNPIVVSDFTIVSSDLTNGPISITNPSTITERLSITNIVTMPGSTNRYLEALKAATELRSGMIYLRPASAYLRSSYPAAALQGSAGGQVWNNMLLQHAARQIPWVGPWLSGDYNSQSKTFAAIDAQSWQNINRVRVAGAGTLNYVVAKDDVGNWYVKGLSADPSNIFKAAKNLAFFAAGSSLGSALPILTSNGVVQNSNSVLSVQFAFALSNYAVLTSNTFQSVLQQTPSLGSQVSNNLLSFGVNDSNLFAANSNSFTSIVMSAVGQAATNGTNAFKANLNTQISVWDTETLNILRSVKRYAVSLESSGPSGSATNAVITKTVRPFLHQYIDERNNAVGRFQSALDVVNGGASSGQ